MVSIIVLPLCSFNSRTPGGVRHSAPSLLLSLELVSIHAPREGCDRHFWIFVSSLSMFQFTHPGRGATTGSGDPLPRLPSFNSRTPGGVRQSDHKTYYHDHQFQFTHPGRGATGKDAIDGSFSKVSIHAPREGCDHNRVRILTMRPKFQFTHPGRGATRTDTPYIGRRNVSIHAPREGCDLIASLPANIPSRFNSRTPGGVRRQWRSYCTTFL